MGGATSTVYKVCPHGCRRPGCVAVKVPKVDGGDNEADVHAAITQAVRGTEDEHHFNKLVRVEPSPTGPILTTTFEDGRTLEAELEERVISRDEWKGIVFQVLHILLLAQDIIPGFTHNDFHAGNIILVPNTGKRVQHRCTTLTSALHLSIVPKRIVRIIDFGTATANAKRFQTHDGLRKFRHQLGNKFVDFARFATMSVYYCSRHEHATGSYPSWYAEWLEFLSRWFDPRFFLNGTSSSTFISNNGHRYLPPGIKWLTAWYGPSSKYSLEDVLEDEYFE